MYYQEDHHLLESFSKFLTLAIISLAELKIEEKKKKHSVYENIRIAQNIESYIFVAFLVLLERKCLRQQDLIHFKKMMEIVELFKPLICQSNKYYYHQFSKAKYNCHQTTIHFIFLYIQKFQKVLKYYQKIFLLEGIFQ